MGVAMHASTIRNNLIGKKCVAERAVRFAVDNSDFFSCITSSLCAHMNSNMNENSMHIAGNIDQAKLVGQPKYLPLPGDLYWIAKVKNLRSVSSFT